jgi:FemAB-related protein (PEP-CTERM system-associated)
MTAVRAHDAADNELGTRCETQIDRPEWDAYVRKHQKGSFFHLSGWCETVRDAYGYEPAYITARRNGSLAGIMPIVDVQAPLLGRSLISTAFTVGGGPLANDDEALKALLSAAIAAGEDKRVKYIECRSDFAADGWILKPATHAGFKTALIADQADALAAIPRKRRAEIRKAIAAAESGELSIRHDGNADIFYELYAKSLKRLGTPVFPRQFLDALLGYFGEQSEISVVSSGGTPVCALLTFYHDDVALPYYVGAENNARALRAFDFLYWSAMRRAVARNCKIFDFGRSKIDSGPYHYKKLWGIEPQSLAYRIKMIKAAGLPNISPNNPKFVLFSQLWPRLPLAAANRLGPLLAPNFP